MRESIFVAFKAKSLKKKKHLKKTLKILYYYKERKKVLKNILKHSVQKTLEHLFTLFGKFTYFYKRENIKCILYRMHSMLIIFSKE